MIEHFIVEQDFNELYRIHNIENIHICYGYDQCLRNNSGTLWKYYDIFCKVLIYLLLIYTFGIKGII